jgi:hypothetical protein
MCRRVVQEQKTGQTDGIGEGEKDAEMPKGPVKMRARLVVGGFVGEQEKERACLLLVCVGL